MDIQKKCEALVRAAPPLREEALRIVNISFTPYLFRRRRTGEVWTTCCGRHEVLPRGHEVLEAAHTPAPAPVRVCCHWGYMSAPPEKPSDPVPCPFCGRVSTVKELGRTGSRKNLWSCRRVVVLRWYRKALWAMAYEFSKSYEEEDRLTALPSHNLCAVYRFAPHSAKAAVRFWWNSSWSSYRELNASRARPDFKFPEPFHWSCEYETAYDVIGLDEIERSPFRWCMFREYAQRHSEPMRFLALCTVYPRQVEMLMKAGMDQVVADFVCEKKANARAFSWDEPDPMASFGLDRQELKAFLKTKKRMDVLCAYKQLRRRGMTVPFERLDDLHDHLGPDWFQRVVTRLVRYRLSWDRLERYLDRENVPKGKKAFLRSVREMAELWCDYIDAAQVLGYDMKNPVFLMPKGLDAHHDKAADAAAGVLAAKRAKHRAEKEKARQKALARKYTYSDGRWLIRPPTGAAEIVAEGKALKHCVGGYAGRHVNGKVTILFLRDRNEPGKPRVTIEMNGDRIVQIHGYDDERRPCRANPKRVPPRELYREFLEPWLEWLAAGSKRDKKGRPKLPTGKVAAA